MCTFNKIGGQRFTSQVTFCNKKTTYCEKSSYGKITIQEVREETNVSISRHFCRMHQ
ncbi:hypothetical protein L579_3969 [Pantoea sp. AS-PWVM4]|nr:hypothetical protein L579_3969 [Pantoea sp. AS-PWVM4]